MAGARINQAAAFADGQVWRAADGRARRVLVVHPAPASAWLERSIQFWVMPDGPAVTCSVGAMRSWCRLYKAGVEP